MPPTRHNQKPQPGDLIEVFRPYYQHWALYIGHGYVIHLAPPCEVAGAGAYSLGSATVDRAYVKKERLCDVVGDDDWTVHNLLDDEYEPFDADVVVKNAKALVGELRPYCVCSRNCEHFVTELRYGKAESRQVRKVKQMAVAGGLTFFGMLAAGLLWKSFSSRNRSRETTRTEPI